MPPSTRLLPAGSRRSPGSIGRNGDAPGIGADRHGADRPEAGDVDHRDVVGDAVGRQQVLLVGREGHLPDALADEQVLLDLKGLLVDHGDAVGRPQRHEGGLAIGREADADRLDRLGVDGRAQRR